MLKIKRFVVPKKFEDEKMEVLLHKDACQTLDELSELLSVDDTTVPKCLKTLGIIRKQKFCVPYELKLRDVNAVSSRVNSRFFVEKKSSPLS